MANKTFKSSIFDFIYLDQPKIRSYMAQMRGGIRLEHTNTTSETASNEHLSSLSIKGEGDIGVPFVVQGKGGMDSKVGSSEQSGASHGMSTKIDLEHMLPRDMINTLIEEELVKTDFLPNNLGKLVLVKGKLLVLDMKKLADSALPTLDFYLKNIATADERKEFKQNKVVEGMQSFKKMYDTYPVRVQGYLKSEDDYAWFSLDENSLMNNHHDIAFKYDMCSTENFYVLGVLDAVPTDTENEEDKAVKDEFREKIGTVNDFFDVLMAVQPVYRELAGRPDECYGLSPVAIFRQLESQ